MRQAVETGKAQLELARQNLKRQQDLWNQQLTTRELLDKAVNDVKVAESSLSERDKTANAQAARIAQEHANLDSAQYDLSKVRIVSPIDGIVTAPHHSRGRDGDDRHDEQRRHRADDAGRHVDDPGRDRSRRDQRAERAARPEGEDHDRRDPRQVVQRARDGNRQQPDSDGDRRHDRHPGDQLQGEGRPRRSGAERPPRLHVHRRHHDGDAQERRRRCRFRQSPCASSCTTPRDRWSSRRTPTSGSGAPDAAAPRRGAEAGPDAQGNRGRVRRPRQQGRVRADQDGHRRRQVLRGALRAEGRRSGRHRPVQLGARHGRRRSREGRQRRTKKEDPGLSQWHEQVPRLGRHRAQRHLGRQAAVVHDGPRQHRGGHVDHRGGVDDSGAERLGEGRDPQPGGRRLVQHPAVSDHAQRRGLRQGRGTTRGSPCRTRAPSAATATWPRR